jgi:hypothetical protein
MCHRVDSEMEDDFPHFPIAKSLNHLHNVWVGEVLSHNLTRSQGIDGGSLVERWPQTRAIEVPTVFRDFEDYWSPFLGGQGPAPGYYMSLFERRRSARPSGLHSRLSPTEAFI